MTGPCPQVRTQWCFYREDEEPNVWIIRFWEGRPLIVDIVGTYMEDHFYPDLAEPVWYQLRDQYRREFS